MIKSYRRGHEIACVDDVWIYVDDKTPTEGTERNCGFCGEGNTVEDHDGCLGTLPNVRNACCGHGQVEESYVQFEDGSEARGVDAHVWIEAHKTLN